MHRVPRVKSATRARIRPGAAAAEGYFVFFTRKDTPADFAFHFSRPDASMLASSFGDIQTAGRSSVSLLFPSQHTRRFRNHRARSETAICALIANARAFNRAKSRGRKSHAPGRTMRVRGSAFRDGNISVEKGPPGSAGSSIDDRVGESLIHRSS